MLPTDARTGRIARRYRCGPELYAAGSERRGGIHRIARRMRCGGPHRDGGPGDFSALDAWEVNTRLRTEGTRRLLDASLAAGVRHCVLERVALAYPDGGDRWLDESTPLDDSPPARLSARR